MSKKILNPLGSHLQETQPEAAGCLATPKMAPSLSKPYLKFSSITEEKAGTNEEHVIRVGMESKSSQAVYLTENCILKVTVAPMQTYQENGSASGSPRHELHELPCHEFLRVREAGKNNALP